MTSPQARERLLQQIARLCGQTLREQRANDVVAAAERAAGGALDDVACDDAFVRGLVDDVVVPETYFFRQPVHFDHLAGVLARGPRRPVRLWSAGCASGEEAWSLAMTLDEHGWLDDATILATDLSPTLLERARAGRYRGWSLRGDSGRRAERWLHKDGADLVVADRLRRAVRFEVFNLAHDAFGFAAPFDAVFCRNVLLYLNRDVVDRCAVGFFSALRDGGSVYTAAADPPLTAAPFRMIATLGVAWEKNGDEGRAHPPARGAAATQRPTRPRRQPTPHPRTKPSTPPQETTPPQPTASPETPPENRTARTAARAAADEGRVDDALAAVDVALADDPLSVPARHLRCLLLLARGDPQAALVEGRRLLYVAPHLVVGHLLMHRIHLTLGDTAAARRAAVIALRCAERAPPGPLPLGDGATVDDAVAECRALLTSTAPDDET